MWWYSPAPTYSNPLQHLHSRRRSPPYPPAACAPPARSLCSLSSLRFCLLWLGSSVSFVLPWRPFILLRSWFSLASDFFGFAVGFFRWVAPASLMFAVGSSGSSVFVSCPCFAVRLLSCSGVLFVIVLCVAFFPFVLLLFGLSSCLSPFHCGWCLHRPVVRAYKASVAPRFLYRASRLLIGCPFFGPFLASLFRSLRFLVVLLPLSLYDGAVFFCLVASCPPFSVGFFPPFCFCCLLAPVALRLTFVVSHVLLSLLLLRACFGRLLSALVPSVFIFFFLLAGWLSRVGGFFFVVD